MPIYINLKFPGKNTKKCFVFFDYDLIGTQSGVSHEVFLSGIYIKCNSQSICIDSNSDLFDILILKHRNYNSPFIVLNEY